MCRSLTTGIMVVPAALLLLLLLLLLPLLLLASTFLLPHAHFICVLHSTPLTEASAKEARTRKESCRRK